MLSGTKRKKSRKSTSARKRYRTVGSNAFKQKSQAASTIQAAVRRALQRNMETKKANYTTTDGNEIFHNNFISLTPNILATTQGTSDPQGPTNQNCRIGDEISLKGASLRMMVELNERYSDVTFRLMVVKASKGDTPTRATLFNGLSGNKMLDSLNTERYTILYQKYFKIKAPNVAVSNGTGGTTEVATTVPPTSAGIFYAPVTYQVLSRGTKIIKCWIPGNKLVRQGIVKYEDNSSQPKFFDYHVLLYAYSNYDTDQDLWYVARVNDYVQQLYFKDS